MNQNITLEVNDDEIRFDVNLEDYNNYVNALGMNDKVAPAHNFCVTTVNADDKPKLMEYLDMPSLGIQLAGQLVEEFTPEVNITVKKSKPVQKRSKTTD